MWFPKAYLKGMWLPCWCWIPFKWFHYQCNPTFAQKQKHSSFGNFCRVDLEPLALLWADAVVWISKYLKKHWMKHHDKAIKGRKPPQPEFRRPPNQETTADRNDQRTNHWKHNQPPSWNQNLKKVKWMNDAKKKNTAQLHVVTESWRKQGKGQVDFKAPRLRSLRNHRLRPPYFSCCLGGPPEKFGNWCEMCFWGFLFSAAFWDIGFFLRSADCFPHLTFCCVFQQIWTFCLLFACFFASWKGCGMIWSWKGLSIKTNDLWSCSTKGYDVFLHLQF